MKNLFVFAVLLLSFNFSAWAAEDKCEQAFAKPGKKEFTAEQLTEVELKKLIGTNIQYSGKYNVYDPQDKRTVEGKGLVVEAKLWARDAKPSFSIKYKTESGLYFTAQTFVSDTSFKLEVISKNELDSFYSYVKENNLTLRPKRYADSVLFLAEFFREMGGKQLRIAFVSKVKGQKNFSIQQIDSTEVEMPSEFDIVMSAAQDQLVLFKFLTPDGVVEIYSNDIVEIAYKE